jgi:HAD superfamily hydrolase (TIGR01509 family)
MPVRAGPRAKPAAAIFERALAQLGCVPAEAVFADDHAENVVRARSVGLHAIHGRDVGRFTGEPAPRLGPEA